MVLDVLMVMKNGLFPADSQPYQRATTCRANERIHHFILFAEWLDWFYDSGWPSPAARLRASGCSGSFVLYNQRQLIGVDVVNVAVDVDLLWRTF